MESPLVCDMQALSKEQRSRHGELANRIRPAVIEFIELPDGYSARFEATPERVLEIAEFITLNSALVSMPQPHHLIQPE